MLIKLNDDITLEVEWKLYVGSTEAGGDDPDEILNIEAKSFPGGNIYTLDASELEFVEIEILNHVKPFIKRNTI